MTKNNHTANPLCLNHKNIVKNSKSSLTFNLAIHL